MSLYRDYGRKKNNFLKNIMIIAITIGVTLFADRSINKANEMDEFAERIEYEKNIEIKEQEIPKEDEDYIDEVLKCTVGISVLKPSGSNIFDLNVEEKWGIGTGVIVSEKGYILTNQHLAQKKGARLIVTLNSGKTVQGKVVWVEENIDLAIVKIEEGNLTSAKLADSNKLKIGNEVIAIRKSTWRRISGDNYKRDNKRTG